MKTRHYKNIDGVIFGYKAHEDLTELSESELQNLKKEQDLEFQMNIEAQKQKTKLYEINTEISILKNISDRSTEEEAKLQSLIAESQEIYRYLNPQIEEEMTDTEEVQE